MITIKELENTVLNYLTTVQLAEHGGYHQALKDVLGLIDERLAYLRQFRMTGATRTKVKELEKLKARINGTSENTTKAKGDRK